MSLKSVKTLTASQIAKKWKLSQKTVNSLIDDGSKVEHEHDKDMNNAKQIARDHIAERPDYYKKLRKMEKSKISMKEESATGDVRGLGNVTGDPAIGDNSYVTTNGLAYDPMNGAKIQWMKKYSQGHNAVGFDEYNPTKLKEGLSTEPERDTAPIGDYTGASRKVMKVDEVKLPKIPEKVKTKVKKAVGTGATLATVMSGATAYDNASRGVGSPIKDIASVAAGTPGKVGWAITPGSATLSLANYIKSRQQAKKMQEQGSPANPARYTERPMYEKNGNNLSSGEVERGIYESPRVKFVSKQNPADLPPRPADYKPGDFGSKLAREGGIKYPGKKKPSRPIKEEQIDEISAELVGKVSNARFWRKEAPSKTLTRAINKKFIESGKKKEEPKKPLKEETTMDTKELINEALDDILENNLVSMKENLMTALQEKAMEKIEEKKKEIAANYFAQ